MLSRCIEIKPLFIWFSDKNPKKVLILFELIFGNNSFIKSYWSITFCKFTLNVLIYKDIYEGYKSLKKNE